MFLILELQLFPKLLFSFDMLQLTWREVSLASVLSLELFSISYRTGETLYNVGDMSN